MYNRKKIKWTIILLFQQAIVRQHVPELSYN